METVVGGAKCEASSTENQKGKTISHSRVSCNKQKNQTGSRAFLYC